MYLCAVNNILAEIMPRQERLQSATGIYHVMLRGINKQDIFEDDEDYIKLLKILNVDHENRPQISTDQRTVT